jgi:hypothetical protein
MYTQPANPKQYIVMQLEKIKVAGTKPLLNKQDLDTSECCPTTAPFAKSAAGAQHMLSARPHHHIHAWTQQKQQPQ